MPAAEFAAATMVIAGGGLLVALVARLARAGHRAQDLGEVDAPWVRLAAAASLLGIATLFRAVRYGTGTWSEADSILHVVVEGGAAVLVIQWLGAARRSRGSAADGTMTAGLILLATAVASTLVIGGPNPLSRTDHALLSVSAGLLAWALNDAALFVKAHGREPGWVPSFAAAGAQALVISMFARALAVNAANVADSWSTVAMVHSFSILLAVGLAAPCLAAAAHALARRGHAREAAAASAEAGSQVL